MSWKQDSNGSTTVPWRYRLDVTVDASGLTGTANTDGTNDVNVVLPATLGELWARLDASGNELVVTEADGVTELDFKLTDAAFTGSADVASRDVGLQIDDVPIRYGGDTNGRLSRFCIYYGLSGYTPSHAAFTASSALTGQIEIGRPPAGQRAVVILPPLPGQTIAPVAVSKNSQESIYVWLDVQALLGGRVGLYAKRALLEEVLDVFNDSETNGMRERTGGSDSTTMVDVSSCSFVSVGERQWLKVYVTGGTDGTDYAVIVPFRTTEGQTLNARFRVQVRDVDDT